MPIAHKQSNKPVKKKTGGIMDRIKPIGFDSDDGIKCMLYGQSGSGKTTLWSTFPAPILAIICSGGVKSGELRSIDTPENRKRIKSIAIQDTTEIKDIIEQAAPEFATVVLDHVSGLQDFVLKEILGLEELPAQKSWGMASQQDYGQCTQMCKEYLRSLLNSTGNVVIIGQERVFNSSEDGVMSDIIQPTVGVATTPSLAGWLNPAVDFILQTFKKPKMIRKEKVTSGGKKLVTMVKGKGVEYCARCEAHETYTTKFRTPKGTELPEYIVNPTYDAIMSLIKGEKVK